MTPVIRPIQSVPCRTGPKARKLERLQIENMLAMNVIEHKQTKRASPAIFKPKENKILRPCVAYKKRSFVTISDSNLFERWTNAQTSWKTTKYFQLSAQKAAISRLR